MRLLHSKSPLAPSLLSQPRASHPPQPAACAGLQAGKRQESKEPAWRETGRSQHPQAKLRPILPTEPAATAAQRYLLMREMQLSAWLRSGELLRLFRLSPSLTRACSTMVQEAGEGGQAVSDVLRSRACWLQGPRQHRGSAKAQGSLPRPRSEQKSGHFCKPEGLRAAQQLLLQAWHGLLTSHRHWPKGQGGARLAGGAQGPPHAQEQLPQPSH